MAGKLVRLLPKTFFDWSGLQIPATQNQLLLQRIDLTGWTEASLILRTHAANLTGGSILFFLQSDGQTDQDPGVLFQGAGWFAGVFATTPAPGLTVTGGAIKGESGLLIIQGSHSIAGPLNATVSLDLLLRAPG